MTSITRLAAAGLFATVASTTAFAQILEVEANDSKATATPAAGMTAGQYLDGNSISATTTGLDYWLVSTAAAAPGIYRHELVITTAGTAGHTGTIRGLNQTGGVVGVCPANGTSGAAGTTDTTIQTSSTASVPPRMNAWYGFGHGEQIYYRVTGTASTTANYNATLSSTAVTPISVPGTFAAGLVTFKCNGVTTTDTDILLLDGNFNLVTSAEGGATNDDEHCQATNTLQSFLGRTLAAGTYYLGVGAYNTCSSVVSPTDDDFLTGALLDLGDAFACSSTTLSSDRDVVISDGVTTYTATGVVSTKYFEIMWYQFTVGNSGPVTMCDPGAGGVMACPCGNAPAGANQGCANSLGAGAAAAGSGSANLAGDTLVITGSGIGSSGASCAGNQTNLTCILLQGNALSAGGTAFNDGVRCFSGSLKRLETATSSAGVFTSTVVISTTSAALGDTITAGTKRWYGVWYRDACASHGCVNVNSNVTNTVEALWN